MVSMSTARCATPGCMGLVLKLRCDIICYDKCLDCRRAEATPNEEKTNGTDSAPAPV
jgi:hypothetical protein